ncbi:HDOD domain-containing protein [Pseudocolwellia sp. AS88]|uniref:HDOD domain-containing protein n=1 Tax=Pseudocolwellia sp. AS88 TaxID=3063958 RepID=UPI0026F3637A|nr:HDOD domain-containing protein [Pseudocolwellia sp. AS88]MDO7086681.1 HDOD domain-containing protein [Pseudocolwellia sp. AS88]
MAAENALYTILVEKIKQNSLILPTLPEIALKVRDKADSPDVNLGQMSDIISQDPALSLGMIKVANSPLLSRTVKVQTVNQAVTRIGLTQIKSIATAMVVEQIFVSKNKIVSIYLAQSWKNTVNIAAVAIALMTFYKRNNKHSSLSLDELTLASLVHSIGVLPILTEAEKHSDVFANPTFLEQAITKLSNKLGAEVTKAWGFSDELVELVRSWNDLSVLPKEAHYLDFIRAGAIYNDVFKNEETCNALLKSYVDKGVLPDVLFMKSEEFTTMVDGIKEMF